MSATAANFYKMTSLVRSVPPYFILYIGLVSLILIISGVGIYPDRLIFLTAIPVALLGRLNSFLKAWTPFLLFLFAYEFLRGVIGSGDPRVNYLTMPNLDLAVWGVLPTIWLQQHLFNPLQLHWYDLALTGIYLLHFVVPVLFGLFLWLGNKDHFRRYAAGFVLLSYAALVTYLLFPAAPPWLASQHGLIPPVTKILDQTLKLLPQGGNIYFPSLYNYFDANIVAAVPSLHAAYPMLISLFAIRFYGWRGTLTLPYTLSVWIMVIYFGEHYFSDVVLGILYALLSYLVVETVLTKIHFKDLAHTILSKFSAWRFSI